MGHIARLTALVGASLALVATAQAAATAPPSVEADRLRAALVEAEAALVLAEPKAAAAALQRASRAVETALAARPAELRVARAGLRRAKLAVAPGDTRRLAAARAAVWTAMLAASFDEATVSARRSEIGHARGWLLVREFRPPTRFSRAAEDATLALDALAAGSMAPGAAAVAIRTDLLDTYDSRLRSSLTAVGEASAAGLPEQRAEAGALAKGYWSILRPSFVAQRGRAAARNVDDLAARLAESALAPGRAATAAAARMSSALEGFRAAPLSEAELLRRAGQVERFLQLVPIEYGRGVRDGKVAVDFEIQEAITFRDGAEAAFLDIAPVLLARDRAGARSVGAILTQLGRDLEGASRGGPVADPDIVSVRTDEALSVLERIYPKAWRDAAKTADFDVIAATLDRLQAAAAEGDWGTAESARLEAYGIFELGPEQRLRGLAPELFQETEGLFWYGAGDHDGLVQLIKRKATAAELALTRAALDDTLGRSEERIGAGPASTSSVITNSAIIVFREGLEGVLILAALMASMVGAQRRYRRPLLIGVGAALGASVVTWVVAQTVLTSLARYGERLEAIVSLVAIGILLLVLNWFYHRVYWQENLQGLHRRKSRILAGAGLSLAAAQVIGLVALGFSSVYREGFETVLFLQALTLEAGAFTVLIGVLVGFVATLAVFFVVIGLEQKLPHKTMLKVTGILITWVLVIMVGTTVQTLQKVGWLDVSPIQGLELPYWSGVWLGVFPTWEGIGAQAAAALLVIGSYFGAEEIKARRRRKRILAAPVAVAERR